MAQAANQYKVMANGFEFTFDGAEIAVADLVHRTGNQFHLLHNNRSVNAEVLQYDAAAKTAQVLIEGELFEIKIKEELDQMLDQMGFSNVTVRQQKQIKAPMPGMVTAVAVTAGQQVKEGERLLILEAMKMENSIIIHNDATISRVAVKAGQAVDKGQVLVELE